MTKDQWKSLFHRANYLDAPSLLGLYDAFKINNAGRGISLFREDLEVLAETGYRFAGNTKIFSLADDHLFDAWNKTENLQIRPSVCLTFFSPAFISSTGASADAQKAFRSLLKVNLWPNHGTPPKNVASALNRASMCSLKTLRNSTTLALHSYLFNAGVEACAEAATSPDHWNTLLSVFTGDELQPYLAEMPREARGRVLEDGLGL
jgi:hypothetical protein